MKRLLLSITFLFLLLGSAAQTYNNEWISFSQSYYKVKIDHDGLYRIDSAALATAGIPLGAINPKNIQVFQKGIELYIHIQGENDNVFNSGDYILFYAEKNKCSDDSSLFVNSPFLVNPYYSVISDTGAVFLTWNSSVSNLRLTVDTDTSFASYTPSPYYIKENIQAFANDYNIGRVSLSTNSTDPRYMFGEGWANSVMRIDENNPSTQTTSLSFNTAGLYTAGPQTYVSTVYAGASDQNYSSQSSFDHNDHEVTVEYSDLNGSWNQLDLNSFDGFSVYRKTFNLSNAQLGNTTGIRINSVYTPALFKGNSTYVYYAKLVYPQTFNLNNLSEEKMYLPDDGNQAKSYLNISNFNNLASPVRLIDLSNHRMMTVIASGSNFRALVPNTGANKFCFLSSDSNTVKVSKLIPVNGNGSFINYQNLAADSAYLIITSSKLSAGAALYATYRSSAAGGNYNVITAKIHELYDQFAFGVEGHPYAIRNFVKFASTKFPSLPSHLFLIGKSVHAPFCVKDQASFSLRQLPSFGYPSSDNLLTQGLGNPASLAPYISTGRLAAQNDTDIVEYLDKVMLSESQSPAEWQKNVLHFVGGADAIQQNTFGLFMDLDKALAEDTLYGAKVYTFKKTSTAPIGINTNDSIRQVIENGVSLITFFGHGSYVGFEQNIDDPFAYNNSPKFPFLVANSCYSGDIHTNDVYSNSENFVLAKDHGTIGFLATVASGVAYALHYYTNEFYRNLSYAKYGSSYGELSKASVAGLETSPFFPNDSILASTCMEMTLHGDPAVHPYTHRLPDYEITNTDVSFDINSVIDTILIDIKVTNIGKAVNDSFIVYVERVLPSGSTLTFLKKIKAPFFQSHVYFSIQRNVLNGIGLNQFYVHIDHFNAINELSETNNSTNGYISLFIPGGDIVPVYPYQYAIVPLTDSITLKASTADPFAALSIYRIQLDTNDTFSSPLYNTTVSSAGGVVTLPVSLLGNDSVVYFWRVGRDTIDPLEIHWRESSFQVISGKHGWAQAHFHQFKNDRYEFVKYNKPARRFSFANDVRSIFVKDGNQPYLNFASIGYYINNVQKHLWTCGGSNGWSFAVFDSITGIEYSSDTVSAAPAAWFGPYQNCQCVAQTQYAIDFGPTNYCGDVSDWRLKMENFLTNDIPSGNWVLAYSHGDIGASTYSPSLYSAFDNIGFDSIRYVADTVPIIVFGKKGYSPGQASFVKGNRYSDIISYSDTIATNWNSGYIASEIIGPSSMWRSLHWNYSSLETPSDDSIYVKLLGIKMNGDIDTLASISKDSLNVPDLYNYVNASTYPFLKLIAYERDDSSHTPAQLKKWQVIYDQVPEAALNPPLGFSFNNQTVQEGDNIIVQIPVQNISDIPFTDSLLIAYWVEDVNLASHALPYKLKKAPFLPGSFFIDTIQVNTFGYPGANALWIDVNQLNHPKNQLEQYHFNNIARLTFNVNRDKINPLLDVTFDGVHILNGDIVSSKPNVLVTLKDENKFLALNDTADFAVYLRYPGAVQEQRVYFNGNLQFTPAQLPNNSCKILFNPALLNDGKYEFTIQAKDRSSNVSGSSNYKIQFEVVNKASITEVLNYPNPFSTSTRFVFTLTGSETPETFKIQIMTITGKVVREITQDQIGPLHIGRNITEYAWDGKDEFGDQLANGVYLYRVISRLNGETIDHRESGADDYIKKGFGKMVLMR
ncbi:MAG: C25 family cysteine peptidase [Bacteroidia bacterium]